MKDELAERRAAKGIITIRIGDKVRHAVTGAIRRVLRRPPDKPLPPR